MKLINSPVSLQRVSVILKWVHSIMWVLATIMHSHGHTTEAFRMQRWPDVHTNKHSLPMWLRWEVHAKHTLTEATLSSKTTFTRTSTLLQRIPRHYWSRPRRRMPVHLASLATGRKRRRRNRWVPAVWMRALGTQLLYFTAHIHTHVWTNTMLSDCTVPSGASPIYSHTSVNCFAVVNGCRWQIIRCYLTDMMNYFVAATDSCLFG